MMNDKSPRRSSSRRGVLAGGALLGGAVLAPALAQQPAALAAQGIVVTAFGAKGDGRSDDGPAIRAAIEAYRAGKGPLIFPEGVYLVGETIAPEKPFGHVVFLGDVVIKARPGGAFRELKTWFGRPLREIDPPDGRNPMRAGVIYPLPQSVLWDMRYTRYSVHQGSLALDGSRIPGLAALAVSAGHETSPLKGGGACTWERIQIRNCEFGLYGQDRERTPPRGVMSNHSDTLTGATIRHLRIEGSVERGLELYRNQSDGAVIDHMQLVSSGTSIISDNMLVAGTIYMNGKDEKQIGLILDRAALKFGTLHIEGAYDRPVQLGEMSSIEGMIKLGASPSLTRVGSGAAVHSEAARCDMLLSQHVRNLEAQGWGALVNLIARRGKVHERTLTIRQPFGAPGPQDRWPAPVMVSAEAGVDKTADIVDVVASGRHGLQRWEGGRFRPA